MVQAVLADWRTAPVPEKVRAMLGFLEKMTLDPQNLGPADAAKLREAGITEDEIADALHICTAFNLINRLADSMGWEMQSEVAIHRFADMLLKIGYK